MDRRTAQPADGGVCEGETRALSPGWNVDVGHEVRSLAGWAANPGLRQTVQVAILLASAGTTATSSLRPVRPSHLVGLGPSQVERSSPGVESRAVAPASLEACDCDHAPVIP